jgi:hypothetical protein
VEFNPWQWAAQDQLAAAFFREIGLALGRNDTSQDARRRANRFAAYASYLTLGSHLASGIRPLLASALFIAGLLGIGGSLQGVLWLKPNLAIGGLAALVLAALTKWSTEFAKKAAAAFS